MTPGSGLWWFGLITHLIAVAACLAAVCYLGWLSYKDRRHKRRLDAAAASLRETEGPPS